LNKAVKLHLSLAHRIGAKPNGSNNNLVSIRNHVPNINCQVWDLLHQNLKPLRTFLKIILVVALQFMIVKVRSHIPKNGLNVSTVHRFEVTPYKLPVYACLIHSSLLSLIDDRPSEVRAEEQDPRLPQALVRSPVRSTLAASMLVGQWNGGGEHGIAS
jgi:hypothetical protein